MIIRRLDSILHLISQPDHAALALRIMRAWDSAHFPESSRKASILAAIEHHDDGWAEFDKALIVDERSGQLLDFIDAPDIVKRETSWRGIEGFDADPYAGALMAQHRLHVYGRHAHDQEWRRFFSRVTAARDHYLHAAGLVALSDLLRNYRFVRAGDLASLVFCNHWASSDSDECGYAMRLAGTTLEISPDPYGRRSVPFEIEAREIPNRAFESQEDAQQVVASAPVVTLRGNARGMPAST
jgi:hypothetical protein